MTSPYLELPARTELEARLSKLKRLRAEELAARAAHGKFYPVPAHADEEAEVRYEAAKLRACRVSVTANDAFLQAARELADYLDATEQ